MSSQAETVTTSIIPIVMAGGSGTRLWPLSRPDLPKQFLHLADQQSLFQSAVQRGAAVAPNSRPMIIGSSKHAVRIAADLRKLAVEADVFYEPEGRNTAAAVAVAALHAPENATLLVLSADQYIPDNDSFAALVNQANKALRDDEVATISIRPLYAATQFGYVELSELHSSGIGYNVSRFVEKPDAETAGQYVRSGRFLWNSGIFLFPVKAIRRHLQELLPDVYVAAQKALASAQASQGGSKLGDEFLASPSISIDVGVMERCKSVTFPYNGQWSDLGTWDAIRDHLSGSDGNAISGDVKTFGVKQSVVMSSNRLVVASNIENTVVVETSDAVYVGKLNLGESAAQEGSMRNVVQYLVDNERQEVTESGADERPWGRYSTLHQDEDCRVKRIEVEPNSRLSLQSHTKRDEVWVVVRGSINAEIAGETVAVNAGGFVTIKAGEKHRMDNVSNTMAVIVEIQTGSYFGEDDIVRYQDDYGRS